MTTKQLNVALYPQEILWADKEKNLLGFAELMSRIHEQTDLLILPEMFSTGFITGDKEEVRPLAERNTGATIELVKEMAAKYHMAVCGSFIADSGGSLYNRAFFIEPNGDETFADKRHLFTMAGEDKVFSHGYDRMLVRYRGWNIAMVVCYDIRFPVWCRNVDNEYDLLVAVANWPEQRSDAWQQLLKARAIENESYVCGVNCRGIDSLGNKYIGDSSAFDFKGKNINVQQPGNDIIYALLDYDRLTKFRTKFPAWNDADKFVLEK